MKKSIYWSLPMEYELTKKINFAEDKKEGRKITAIQAVLALVAIGIGFLICPFEKALSVPQEEMIAALILSLVVVMIWVIFHEKAHGAVIRSITGKKAEYKRVEGVRISYAASKALFSKSAYLQVVLMPMLVLTGLVVIATVVAGPQWFWYVYIVEICNLIIAAEDLYGAFTALKMPEKTLVFHRGSQTQFYSK